MLAKRWGEIPQETRERVATAKLEVLRSWFDRALDAESLDDVFA